MSQTILVTGGAGYIGSHAVLELLSADYEVVILDNFCNSSKESLDRVKTLTGKEFTFYETDLRDRQGLATIFKNHSIDSVIHFAGLKAVGESNEKPIEYYENNVVGSLVLFDEMEKAGVRKIVFSSSATVYGEPEKNPISETAKLGHTNPYGRTKYMIEFILKDIQKAKNWDIVILRYFNPVGAHASGDIGESPNDVPNNLLPFVTQAAIGVRDHVTIFGDDYDTIDGTGVRDYIHVVDLVLGHIKSLEKLDKDKGLFIYNLGTGSGVSVKEMIDAIREVSKKDIKVVVGPRRAGDVGEVVADSTLAEKELGWTAQYNLKDMAESSWRWQEKNPKGYA
ncbi:MAG: UDP-glucose 4-epimerase GalE [Planctomycetota bacterium]|nr:MAG: UDP-glucose 4-epimerase GalE [Planctomycetota bacterium]